MSISTSGSPPEPIASLLDARAYPHPVAQVELIETHISYVLLAGDYVYKIKKPVDFGFLNFTTLARRRYYCRQEVVLNRRLCSEIYIGVVPIARSSGGYRIGGKGRIAEYAVRMRRLPREGMMDTLLQEGKLTAGMVRALADKVADFHKSAATGPSIARNGSPQAIARNWDENFRQAAPYFNLTISPRQHSYLRAYTGAFLGRNRFLLKERMAQGSIRDCHGDLRAAAVCFTDGICIFDCIEFNRRFRYADVAAEVAFMSMDLDLNGRPDLAHIFTSRYQTASGDQEMAKLIDFYRCYYAFVRGKVESFRLDQTQAAGPEWRRALAGARKAFNLACSYAGNDPTPKLIITCGLTGTGKSALAAALGRDEKMEVISSDVVRKELAGISPGEHRFERFGGGIYSPRFTRLTYLTMMERALPILQRGGAVILDATFSQRWQRELARRLADEAGAFFFCLEFTAAPAAVHERLEMRKRAPSAVSDAGWETYLAQAAVFQPPAEFDEWRLISIDAGQSLERCLADARSALSLRLHPAAPEDAT